MYRYEKLRLKVINLKFVLNLNKCVKLNELTC